MIGTSRKFTDQDVELIREHLFRNPQVVNKEVTAMGILALLQELWRAARPRATIPGDEPVHSAEHAPSMGLVVAKGSQEAQARCGPTSGNPVCVDGLVPYGTRCGSSDIIDTDETAFLLCPHGFYMWARRGAQAVPIHIAGNEKHSSRAMVAATMDGR
jgi:hypothetical protein